MTQAHAWLARVRELERTGELLHAYDTALQGLEQFPGDLWLAHRAVLNLAKSGATRRAGLEFTRLGLDRSTEPDIAALGARIAKDKALAAPPAERAGLLSHAADLYEEIYRRSGGYYPAINVATSVCSRVKSQRRALPLAKCSSCATPPATRARTGTTAPPPQQRPP